MYSEGPSRLSQRSVIRIWKLPATMMASSTDWLLQTSRRWSTTSAWRSQAHTFRYVEGQEGTGRSYGFGDRAIEAHNQLGVKYMVQPMMDFDEKTTTLDDVKQRCDYFSLSRSEDSCCQHPVRLSSQPWLWIQEDQRSGHLRLYASERQQESRILWTRCLLCMFGGGNVVDYMKKYTDQIKGSAYQGREEIGASGKMDSKPIFDQVLQTTSRTGTWDWGILKQRSSCKLPAELRLSEQSWLCKVIWEELE